MLTGIPFLQSSAFHNLDCDLKHFEQFDVKEAKGLLLVRTLLTPDFSFCVVIWKDNY